MANLAKADSRVPQADRKTSRRDSIVPSRRNLEQPQLRASGDIRSGTRGDVGGADALLDLARKVGGTGNSFLALGDARKKRDDIIMEGQGNIDGAAGTVDAEKMKKSLAYSSAVSVQRAQQSWFTSSEELDNKIKELVYSDDDPDPAKREAKVAALIDEHFKAFAVGEDGNIKDFGSPAANRWLAGQMGALREKAGSAAYQAIESRMSEESLTTASEAFRASIRAGVPMDFEENFQNLLPTVDRKAAKQAFITVVKDEAQVLKDEATALFETDSVKARELATRAIQLTERILTSQRSNGIVPVDIPASEVAGGEPSAPVAAAKAAPAPVALIKPFAAWGSIKPTGKIGDSRDGGKRSHNGEDFPMPIGTEMTAPMGGKVTYSYTKSGGHQAFLTMDNGDVMGIAHLKGKPKEGRIEAGEAFALSGNSGIGTGPHAHITMTSKGRKVSPSDYFNGAADSSGSTSVPVGAPAEAAPESVVTAAGKVPLVGGVNAPKGVYSLTPTEAYEFRAFKRDLMRDIGEAEKKGETVRQTNAAMGFLERMNGLGAPPTVSELQEAARRREISVSHLDSLLGQKETEAREIRSEARQVEALANEAERESKEDAVDRHVNGILAPMYAGGETPTKAQERLLKLLPTITDREVRAAVTSQIGSAVGTVIDLRKASPEHKRAVTDFSDWSGTYKQQLLKARLPKGMTVKAAGEKIDSWVNAFMIELGQGNVAPENVPVFMKRAEEWLDSKVQRTFPPRTPTTK